MVAVDTNIIVRLLTADDPNQFRHSEAIFKTERIFIPDTVTQETEWVLRHAYKFSSTQTITALRRLFGLPNVFLQNPTETAIALDWHENGLDFSDALHLAQSHSCDRMVTFDQGFIKNATKLSTIPVMIPKD
jgi:predicted nucleic-acid-binding protein